VVDGVKEASRTSFRAASCCISCCSTSRLLGLFPPLRLVRDVARSLESGAGKDGTVRMVSIAHAPTAMKCVCVGIV